MNLERLQQKLLAAARANPPSDGVPYAFHKRIVARLVTRPAFDGWALWARALWRATTPCIAIMLLLWVWSLASSPSTATGTTMAETEGLSQHFERTMLAGVNESEEVW